ncbi:MAG: AmmeMemoRadiSam system protein B [Phycisphaeraceae bacterium]
MSDAATMRHVRPAAVAGMFYPAEPDDLRQLIRTYLDPVVVDSGEPAPKAVIAPHAGYVYSGPIAASAYARIAAARDTIRRAVVIGPAHRVMFRGLATSSADAFATPLGNVMLDRDAIEQLLTLPDVIVLDEAHAPEHSLEVHLPFLQTVLDPDRFKLVPLVMGEASADQVATVIEQLWGGPETLFVVSSDLSHYLDYEAATRIDAATSQAIEKLRPQDIDAHQACGRIAIQALLTLAPQHHLHARTVDQRNSGDTNGPRDQVVGYGAYVFN